MRVVAHVTNWPGPSLGRNPCSQNTPRVTALLDIVANWNKHRHRWGSDLDGLVDSDVASIAKDIGVSTTQLPTLPGAAMSRFCCRA
jgi:hypothetical protein